MLALESAVTTICMEFNDGVLVLLRFVRGRKPDTELLNYITGQSQTHVPDDEEPSDSRSYHSDSVIYHRGQRMAGGAGISLQTGP